MVIPRVVTRGAARLSLAVVLAAPLAATRPAPALAGGTVTPELAALLGARPYVPLFTEANNCAENRAVNELSGEQLEARLAELARSYTHVHAEASNQLLLGDACRGASPTTLAAKLTARGIWASNYRNGSYVSQSSTSKPLNFGEAADIEARAPLAIATFWPANAKPYLSGDNASQAARLAAPLGTGDTTVLVTSAAAARPAGAPTTWPYVASRGSGTTPGAHSANTHDFASWVRVDDELMQVVAPPVESSGIVSLTVHRGLWGPPAAPHAAGQRVMSPVYIGSTSAVASDANLAGGPNRDDPGYPLRYGVKVWQSDGHGWIASRIKSSFGTDLQGHDTVWLDVSSCAQYNNADASGQPVAGWDDPLATRLVRDRWGAHQKTKLAGLRAALPGVRFTGNNLGGNFNSCTDDLLGNAYDGGVLEHWMKGDAGHALDWAGSMDQNLRIQASDWPALYWVRWNYDYTGDPARYKRFSYGSLLLARRPTATRFQYGGNWGLGRPDELYFWDWGTPKTMASTLGELAVPGTNLYRRDLTNGVVLVNPGTSPVVHALDGTYYDVVNKDAAGQPAPVTSVSVGPQDAAFLLRGVEATDTTAPETAVSAPLADQTFSKAPVAIKGTASDQVGVTAVTISIQDAGSGEWWQPGGGWSATYASLHATLGQPGAGSTSWSYSWPASRSGIFVLRATAADAAGNVDASPAEVRFRFKSRRG